MLSQFLPDHLLTFLQWLFPYGLGGAIAWLFSANLRRARTDKELFESYKGISDQQQENIEHLTHRLGDTVEQLTGLQVKVARLESEKAVLEEVVKASRFCSNLPNCRVAQAYARLVAPNAQKPKGRHRPRDIDMDAPEESSTLSDHPP